MTLRESLGGDAERIHDQVDALLDQEDGVLLMFDGRRVISYAEGFGVSASQLELLSTQIERALRSVVGPPRASNAAQRRSHERHQGTRTRDRLDRDHCRPADGVLRLARKIA